MKSPKREAFYRVKQIIETDDLEAANAFLAEKDGDWILVDTYKSYGKVFYLMGNLKNEENKSDNEQFYENGSKTE